jgi:hypothetical protein
VRIRVAAVVIGAVLIGGCGRGTDTVEPRDASETTLTEARPALPLTYGGGVQRFDPPRDVVARMTPDDAYSAWRQTNQPPNDSPQILFALYTEVGTGKILDNGLTQSPHVRQPVWVIRFQNVAASGSGGGVAYGPGPIPGVTRASSPPNTYVGEEVGIIDDASGQSVATMFDRADDPPSPQRSANGRDPSRTSCPQSLDQYKAGMFDDGATPDPGDWSQETMPRAVLRGSDGDVYQVWGAAGSIERPMNGPADQWPDGVIVVARAARDWCASPHADDEGAIVFHHEPSASGQVTLVSVDGDVVHYRTARGVTGSYNVVTERFAS